MSAIASRLQDSTLILVSNHEPYEHSRAESGIVVTQPAGGARRAVVWIQDYHVALVAQALRALQPALFIHQFWHIPVPPPDVLRLLPEGSHDAVVRGLLGNELVEFQVERHATNFLDCVGVAVDRVDYTKGLPGRLRALRVMWTESPDLRERITCLVVCTPSRSDLAAYSNLEQEVIDAINGINADFRIADGTPIVLVNENVDASLLAHVYRAADLCVVSSLQDGMNLVAKEFVACQLDERGVLLLSRFTGAAEEIEGALLINPFNVDELVKGIRAALDMPASERRERMARMRHELRAATIFDWLEAIMARCDEVRGRPPMDARQSVAT